MPYYYSVDFTYLINSHSTFYVLHDIDFGAEKSQLRSLKVLEFFVSTAV